MGRYQRCRIRWRGHPMPCMPCPRPLLCGAQGTPAARSDGSGAVRVAGSRAPARRLRSLRCRAALPDPAAALAWLGVVSGVALTSLAMKAAFAEARSTIQRREARAEAKQRKERERRERLEKMWK